MSDYSSEFVFKRQEIMTWFVLNTLLSQRVYFQRSQPSSVVFHFRILSSLWTSCIRMVPKIVKYTVDHFHLIHKRNVRVPLYIPFRICFGSFIMFCDSQSAKLFLSHLFDKMSFNSAGKGIGILYAPELPHSLFLSTFKKREWIQMPMKGLHHTSNRHYYIPNNGAKHWLLMFELRLTESTDRMPILGRIIL